MANNTTVIMRDDILRVLNVVSARHSLPASTFTALENIVKAQPDEVAYRAFVPSFRKQLTMLRKTPSEAFAESMRTALVKLSRGHDWFL